MIAYWLMFGLLAIPALTQPTSFRQRKDLFPWVLMGLILVLYIGFRHQVGGDWGNYLGRFMVYSFYDWSEVLTSSDPGYVFVNWLMYKWGYGMYAVNLICAVIFVVGLSVFARRQPSPWLVLAIAFPYLIMIVAMGYTRQGVAIGFILLSLVALEKRQFWQYLVFIALATLFHRTALIMIPLGFFLFGRGWMFRMLALVIAAYALFDAFVAEETEQLWNAYVDSQMISQGAQVRVAMNLVPSLLLLGFWRSWKQWFPDYWFWFWIAIASVACVFMVGFASTAVDRIALYLLPIQLVVFSRLPIFLGHRISPSTTTLAIVAGYAAVLFVWLNFAAHAYAWVPYGNLIFL